VKPLQHNHRPPPPQRRQWWLKQHQKTNHELSIPIIRKSQTRTKRCEPGKRENPPNSKSTSHKSGAKGRCRSSHRHKKATWWENKVLHFIVGL
jgi:hypothetical protein